MYIVNTFNEMNFSNILANLTVTFTSVSPGDLFVGVGENGVAETAYQCKGNHAYCGAFV